MVVEPRRQGIEYSVDHHSDRLFIVTNDEAVNFRLMTAPLESPGRAHWREYIPHRDGIKLESVDLFARHAVLTERADGLQRISVLRLSDAQSHIIDQPEPVYTASFGPNPEWDTDTLRFAYTSLVTPVSAVDYGMDSRERKGAAGSRGIQPLRLCKREALGCCRRRHKSAHLVRPPARR